MFTIEALQEFSADPQKEDNPFYQNPDKLQQKDIDELWNELQERSQLDHNSRFVLAVLQSGVQTGTFSPRKNRATVNSDKVLEKMAAVDISQVSEEIFNRIKLPDMTIEAWKRNHINGFDGATREAGSIAEKIIHDLVNHKGSITHDLTTSLEIIKLWLNSKPREEKTKKALENLILILNKLPVNSKHISSICSLITDTEEQPYSDVAEYIARISEYQFLKIGEENRLRSPERGWREQQWLPSDVDFTQETTKGLLDQLGSKFLYKPTQLLKIFQEASDETRTETFVINVLYELTRDSDLDSLPQKPEEYLAALYLLRNIKALKPEFAKPITKTDTIFGYVPDLTQEHFAGKSWYRSAANIFGPLLIDALENQLVAAQEDESSQQRIFADMNAERVESAIYIALTTPSILERLFNKAKTLQWMFKKLSGQTLKQISNTGNYLLQFSLWLYGFERLEKADQDQLRGEVYKALQNKEIVEKLDSEYLEELLEKFTWAERAGILCTLSEETFAKEYVTKHSKGFKKELQKVLGESSVDTQKLSNLGELGLRYNIIDIDTAFRVLTKMSSIASVDMIIQYLELQIKQLGALSPEQQLTQDINIVAILAVLPRSSRSGIATIKEAAIQRLLDYDKSVWEKASISSKEIRSKFIEGLDPRNDDHLKLILKLACFAKKKLIDSLKSQDKFQELLSTALKRTDLVANILEDDLTLFEKAMNALPDLPKRVDVVNDVFYGTLRNPPGNWLEKTERYRDYVRILNSKDLMRCLEGLMRDIGTNSAAITAFIQALYYAKAINLEIAKKILKDESESLTSAKKYILQSFKEYAISCTTAREGYVFYKHVSKLAKIIFADSDLVKQLSEISDAGNNVFSRWSVIKKEEVNGRARVKWQLEFENPTKLGQPYVDVYNASMIQEGISLSDSPLFFESCLKLAGLEVLLKQFGNYDDTVKELVCGYLCTTAFDKAVGNDAILKYICDNNFEISPELSSEQFRQIIEKAIERKIPFNPACILNSRFNLEPEVVKKLVHQYLSSINEDDENLENFIRQRLMYHEHFGRNLAWLYEVLVKKPKTISKRSREYILQYLPLAANVLRANPDSVKTHRLVAEFCGFAVKKENTDKLDYLGDTGIDRTASIEAILSFKKVHEKSNRGVHRKLRSLHKTKWAGDSKFKKVWWHILNFFGKWKGKIEFSMKKNIRTGHTEDSTEYVLWRIQKGVSQLKATSTDVQVEKQRRRLAQKTAQTLRQFKKAGGKIDSAQKPQFKEGITCFFSQPTDSSTPPSKLSREERRLQQVASQLGIGVVAC